MNNVPVFCLEIWQHPWVRTDQRNLDSQESVRQARALRRSRPGSRRPPRLPVLSPPSEPPSQPFRSPPTGQSGAVQSQSACWSSSEGWWVHGPVQDHVPSVRQAVYHQAAAALPPGEALPPLTFFFSTCLLPSAPISNPPERRRAPAGSYLYVLQQGVLWAVQNPEEHLGCMWELQARENDFCHHQLQPAGCALLQREWVNI